MEALNMAATNPSGSPPGSVRFQSASHPLPPRLLAALAVLYESYEYAQDLEASPWDFATEISGLRRLKLTNSDLRWLVGRGYVEHGVEVTLAGDLERSFQHPGRLLFGKKTCFVLARSGAALAQQLAPEGSRQVMNGDRACAPPALAIASPSPGPMPRWDRDRQELSFGPTVVRRFKIPSLDAETILAALEEAHWPARLDDPLPGDDGPKWRLQRAIDDLNRHQRPALVCFQVDASGRCVTWEARYEAARDV
jgi:hypothetical protein